MKTPYLLIQRLLIASSTVILFLCILGDTIALLVDFESATDWIFMLNMVLSLCAMCVFSYFIIKPEKTCVVKDIKSESAKSIYSATRTYICIIYFDVAIVLALVLFGSANIPYVEVGLIVLAILVFIIGAVKYLFDIRKINSSETFVTESKVTNAKISDIDNPDDNINEKSQDISKETLIVKQDDES